MKRTIVVFMTVLLVGFYIRAWANEGEILAELEKLKQRIEELEAKLEQQDQKLEQQDQKLEDAEYEQAKAEVKDIKDIIAERLATLSIHGGVVGYYQGMTTADIGGEHFKNPNGVGYVADLELAFEPIEDGEFYMRLHAGEGDGADLDLEPDGGVFTDVNTLNDDNPVGEFLDLLDVFYTQSFMDERLFLAVGKTEPVVFIDDNAFANDEYVQFVGKPFVNDPVLDSEDEFTPLLALGFSPAEVVSLVALVQSSSWVDDKDPYSDIFNKPFVAGQVTVSPMIRGLMGNYRLYGWGATYDHEKLSNPNSTEAGWGVGVSLDQMVTPKIGLFARAGYHNEDVYEVPWSWSVGADFRGLIPRRENDNFGIGVAALKGNSDLNDTLVDTGLLLTGNNGGWEWHLETYYRIVLSEFLSITPDLQYVISPLGDPDNDGFFAGMIRAEFYF